MRKSPLQATLRKALPHHCCLPFTRLLREGVPVKGSGPASKPAGRGRDRSGGHRPSWAPASHPGVETASRGGTSPRATGDRDPEESEANAERWGASSRRCFRSGWGCVYNNNPAPCFLRGVPGASPFKVSESGRGHLREERPLRTLKQFCHLQSGDCGLEPSHS